MTLHDLPPVNATLNLLSAGFLFLGWRFIKAGRKRRHIVMMSCALTASAAFLACYLAYHLCVRAETLFTGHPAVRPFYLALLGSHVLLAFAAVPLVIATVAPALRARFERHRRIARWTLPVWFYVSVTGVLVYLMLYQWFPPR